jgi:uncharacterized membrane protein
MNFEETQMRTISKVVTWRVLLTISHIVNGFIVSGSWATGLQIAGLAAIINSVLYWAHERGWNFAQWNRKPADGLLFLEGQPRTISKIVTWRVLITASNFLIPFIMTGSWGAAAAFLGIATIVNVALFYGHERAWNFVGWGKKTKTEEETEEETK